MLSWIMDAGSLGDVRSMNRVARARRRGGGCNAATRLGERNVSALSAQCQQDCCICTAPLARIHREYDFAYTVVNQWPTRALTSDR